MYSSCTCLVEFISSYFMFWNVIKIVFYNYLLSFYRRTLIFVCYPYWTVISPRKKISCKSFRISYIHYDFVNKDSLNVFFPIFMYCILLSSITALAMISSTVLNINGESQAFCLIPYHRGNIFNLLWLFIILVIHAHYWVESISFLEYIFLV